MKLITLALAATFAQLEAPPGPATSAVIVREVVPTTNSVGHLSMHTGAVYDVVQIRYFTNTIARATHNGKVSEIMLESSGPPMSTNLCDFLIVPLNIMPPMPK